MTSLILRKVIKSDKKYFARWWRDKILIGLTSGDFELLSDHEIDEYFQPILNNDKNYNFMIDLPYKTIGHISLSARNDDWYEMQVVIGDKEKWGMGYGTQALQQLINIATDSNIQKIFLDVRPTNVRAIRCYEKCGFRVIEITKHHDNTNCLETLRMELLLSHGLSKPSKR